MNELIWHILLTVCLGSSCVEQDVQWFDARTVCDEMLRIYAAIPPDSDWDSVEYISKPTRSETT